MLRLSEEESNRTVCQLCSEREETAAGMDGRGSCCSSAGGGATPPKHMTNAVSQCDDRDANTALTPSLSSKVTQELHSEHIFASAFVTRRKGVDV